MSGGSSYVIHRHTRSFLSALLQMEVVVSGVLKDVEDLSGSPDQDHLLLEFPILVKLWADSIQ